MKFSPTEGLAQVIGRFARMGQKYGVEWWILVAGAVIILGVILMAIFAGAIAPYNPFDQNTGPQLAPPSADHLMGTDNLQRDVFSRIIFGARTILGVAILAAIISSIVGITIGLISGYSGGAFDRILSLIMDSVYSFPGLILAIAFAAMLEPGIISITFAVAVIYIPTYFRLVRGQTLTIKEELYVEAARAIGAPGHYDFVEVYFSQCHCHHGGGIYHERGRRHHDRGGVDLPGAGAAAQRDRLGDGSCHGKKIPSLGPVVADYVSGSHDIASGDRIYHVGGGLIRDSEPQIVGAVA